MKTINTFSGLGDLANRVWATVGFFDGLHSGHQTLLSCLCELARSVNATSLVITFANLPRAYHQPEIQPKYLTLPEEKLLLLETQGIDAVLTLEYGKPIACQSALQFIQAIAKQCDLRGLCVGHDSTLGHDQLSTREAYQALADIAGIGLVFADKCKVDGKTVKSSQVRRLIVAGDIRGANNLLNQPYFVSGKVVHGKGKGEKLLSTPTANLVLPPMKLSPPLGVYACTCKVGDTSYPAATAVMNHLLAHTTSLEGADPTLPPSTPPDTIVVEAHLDGFSGDLYGQQIKLDFHARLRDWVHFNSPTELHRQIQADIEETRRVCSVYL